MEKVMLFLAIVFLVSCKSEPNKFNNKTTSEIKAIGRGEFCDSNSFLITTYASKYGNEIELRGYASNQLCQIKVTKQNGIASTFPISDGPSEIFWENEKFMFVWYGCGTSCWGAKVLDLMKGDIIHCPYYVYDDSINNVVVYFDEEDWDYIVLEDLETRNKKRELMDFCQKAIMPQMTIDTIIFTEKKGFSISYESGDCKTIKTKTIALE